MAMSTVAPVLAQKSGGVLKQYVIDSSARLSSRDRWMAVFNNLVMFDEHVPQNTLASVVPDLATGWSWSEDGPELVGSPGQPIRAQWNVNMVNQARQPLQ